MGLQIVTPPLTSPVSVVEARRQCRIHAEDATYDADLEAYIAAAVSHMDGPKGVLQRCLEPQTWDLTLDSFSDSIRLPLGPVLEVDEVKYYDEGGDEQTLDAEFYTVDLASSPQWLVLNDSYSWPATLSAVNAVRIRFTAGYRGELDSGSYVPAVPMALRQAILLLVGHWFAHREAVNVMSTGQIKEIPLAFDALVKPYKTVVFA